MKIIEYINSRDVRDYLEKKDWTPTPTLMAWIINNSKNHTLDERFSALEELMSEFSDEPLACEWGMTLFEFLRRYIKISRDGIERFKSNSDCAVYSYSLYTPDSGWIRDGNFYLSFDRVMKEIHDDGDIENTVIFSVRKDYIDGCGVREIIYVSPSCEIVKIGNLSGLSDEEYSIFYEVLDGMDFDVPTPFVRGDILTETNGKYCTPPYYAQTVVLDRVGKKDENGRFLSAHGYFLGEDEVYIDFLDSHLDLEYSKGEDVEGMHTAISSYLKGKTNLSELLSAAIKKEL